MTTPQIADKIQQVERGLIIERALRSQPAERATLADRMRYYKVPGVGIAVIEDYRVEWARGYGVREARGQAPVDEATLFQAASISKPVAALAALRLVEAGRLDLDADVNSVLTSWKVPPNGLWQPRVTLRHLLCHGGGLTVHGFPGYNRDGNIPTLGQVLRGEQPSNTPAILVNALPGTQFRYSGGGFCVLQQLLEDVVGKPFPQLMRELVLEPLGMAHSTYEQPLPAGWAGNAAVAHRWGGGPVAGQWHVFPEMAAAGLWTTPSDIARFAVELLLAAQGRSNKVLSMDMVNQMLTVQVQEPMGLGMFVRGSDDATVFMHGGSNEGFRCDLVVFRNLGRGAIVMTNSDSGDDLILEVIRAIAEVYGWPRPEFLPREHVLAEVAPQIFDTFTGRYELKPGFLCAVTTNDQRLFFQPDHQPAFELHPEFETKYFANEVELEIEFVRDANGAVTGLTFRQNGDELPAKKLV